MSIPLNHDVLGLILQALAPSEALALISSKRDWFYMRDKLLPPLALRLEKRKSLSSLDLSNLCLDVARDSRALMLLRSEYRRRSIRLLVVGVIGLQTPLILRDKGDIIYLLKQSVESCNLRLIVAHAVDDVHKYLRSHTPSVAILLGRHRPLPYTGVKVIMADKFEEGLERLFHLKI